MRAQRSLEYAEPVASEIRGRSQARKRRLWRFNAFFLFSFVLPRRALTRPRNFKKKTQARPAATMASPGGGGGAGRGGNSRRHQQQQQQEQQQYPSFEAPSPPRVPAAAAAAAAAAASAQERQQQQLYSEDTNNAFATLSAQLPVLAADPYYGALIGTLPAPVRARLEREGGHRAGAATAGADVVGAAREHYYHLSLGATQQEGEAAGTTATTASARAPRHQQQQQQKSVVFINPKQYHRILVRRAARAREAAKGAGAPRSRGAFMHASRHEAALRRPRVRGKFLPKGASANANGGTGGSGGGGGGNDNNGAS